MLGDTNYFFVYRDSRIPEVQGDICTYFCHHQTVYIAYWLASVLCKKKYEAILTKIPCFGAALWLYRFKYLRTMCSAISVEPPGMVQPIAVAVLETFVMTNKDGALHPSTCWLSFLQTLKGYELITLIYNRKSCRLDLLSFRAPEDIILQAIRPGSTKFEEKYFKIQTAGI